MSSDQISAKVNKLSALLDFIWKITHFKQLTPKFLPHILLTLSFLIKATIVQCVNCTVNLKQCLLMHILLQFIGIQVGDAGRYICRAQFSDGVLEASADVIVNGKLLSNCKYDITVDCRNSYCEFSLCNNAVSQLLEYLRIILYIGFFFYCDRVVRVCFC